MDTDSNSKPEVGFKKIKKRNIRKRSRSPSPNAEDESNGDLEPSVLERLESHKELQKLRQRPHGVNVVSLALGKKPALEDEVLGVTDPFRSKTGGMVDMDAVRTGKFQQNNDDAYDVGIGTQFSAETNTRDEDAEMLKYIDSELKKRKSNAEGNGEKQAEASKFLTPEEAALNAIPEYLRKSSSTRSEEMLSNQMLSGIPEVDLGVDVKIKNIVATEDAKEKILRDRMNKKEGPSQFVPLNMAVNFVQHNRFNIEEPNAAQNRRNQRREPKPEKPKKVVVVGSAPEVVERNLEKEKGADRATDDFHFERFKKQFRRF